MDSLLRDSVTSERFRIYTFFKFRLILILLKCTNGLVQFLKVRAIIKSSRRVTKMKIVRDKGLITEQDPESDRLTGHPFHPWRARIADR